MISQLDHLSTSLFHALALHHSTAWCPQLPWHWYQSSRKHLGASVTEWVGVLQTWELYNIYIYVCVCSSLSMIHEMLRVQRVQEPG